VTTYKASIRLSFARGGPSADRGVVYEISLSLTRGNAGQVIAVSRSPEGGRSLGRPDRVCPQYRRGRRRRQGIDHGRSARRAPYVYAVWDRLTNQNSRNPNDFRRPAWYSRTADGGATWEPARIIVDPGANASTIGNQIVVLPDGAHQPVYDDSECHRGTGFGTSE
jgi:hypothetical protein